MNTICKLLIGAGYRDADMEKCRVYQAKDQCLYIEDSFCVQLGAEDGFRVSFTLKRRGYE